MHHARFLDRRGRFEVMPVGAGLVRLRAEAVGYLPARLTLMVPPGERAGEVTARDLRITLVLAGSVAGVVTGAHGQPQSQLDVSGGEVTARSDGAGHYRLSPLPAGVVTVGAGAASGTVTVVAGQRHTSICACRERCLQTSDQASEGLIVTGSRRSQIELRLHQLRLGIDVARFGVGKLEDRAHARSETGIEKVARLARGTTRRRAASRRFPRGGGAGQGLPVRGGCCCGRSAPAR